MYLRQRFLSIAAPLLFASLTSLASASTFDINFAGGGVSGSITLTYGSAMDAKTPGAYEVTGIAGTITDTNISVPIVNSRITGLVPLNRQTPEPGNNAAPNDFSRFPVASGLAQPVISYDNLLYPAGSPPTATDYPFGGGSVDIYGLLFTISNGDVVNFWSNGVMPGVPLNYGLAVVTPAAALDYVGGGVAAATPEPGSLCLLATGVAGLLVRRRFWA